YWELVEKYFQNLVDHNQTAIYTPLFTPPLDDKKRDLQLVGVCGDRFALENVARWLDVAQAAGFRFFEMSHLFSQWGAAKAIRILENGQPLWDADTPATSDVYRNFLQRFLPALVSFLKGRGVFERCIFHLSDEPGHEHLEQYRAVREMVKAIVPELRTTEALSDVSFFKE